MEGRAESKHVEARRGTVCEMVFIADMTWVCQGQSLRNKI